MLLLFVLLLAIGQTLYGVMELMGRDGRFVPTTWIVAGLAFALAEVIRRQNQQSAPDDEEKQLRTERRKHPLQS